MRSNDLHLTRNRQYNNHSLKMTKTRTITVLMIIVSTIALILSMTDAYPTTEIVSDLNSTAVASAAPKPANNTHLVITHIVKTIEFEVDLVEDDGLDGDNATDVTTPEYIETDIKLLNVGLLKELLDQASEDDNSSTTVNPQEEGTTKETERAK